MKNNDRLSMIDISELHSAGKKPPEIRIDDMDDIEIDLDDSDDDLQILYDDEDEDEFLYDEDSLPGYSDTSKEEEPKFCTACLLLAASTACSLFSLIMVFLWWLQ